MPAILATGSISPSALSLAGHSQAWNEILSENGFIKNLCSREWSFLVGYIIINF
jgi:hypothetical protein